MAKIVIKKSVEIYGEEYSVGDVVPYICLKNESHELFYPKIQHIYDNGEIVLAPKFRESLSEQKVIHVEDIVENEKMHRFEYRGMSGSYYISHQGIVYAKTPQEAMERIKDVALRNCWNKEKSEWKDDTSYVELFYNGISCPARTGIYLFPEAYNELNVKNKQFTNKKFLQNIADKISKQTKIENKLVKNNNWPTWYFDYGISYMTTCNRNGLHFTLIDEKGYEIWSLTTTNPDRFVREVSEALNREILKNKEHEEMEK